MLSRRAFLLSAVAERETGRLQQPCHLFSRVIPRLLNEAIE
jgi:hypothetical protein